MHFDLTRGVRNAYSAVMTEQIDLRKFRRARNWTQTRLADELGVNLSTVWRWENERASIKPYVRKALERIGELYPKTITHDVNVPVGAVPVIENPQPKVSREMRHARKVDL